MLQVTYFQGKIKVVEGRGFIYFDLPCSDGVGPSLEDTLKSIKDQMPDAIVDVRLAITISR